MFEQAIVTTLCKESCNTKVLELGVCVCLENTARLMGRQFFSQGEPTLENYM